MNWIKQILGITKLKEDLQIAKDLLAKAEIEKAESEALNEALKSDAKLLATTAGEPYIEIVTMELNSENPSLGSFELDWNEHFVKKLRAMGYPGKTDEIVVDLWFQDVCRNILLETYEQEQANRAVGSVDNIRYISRRDIGNGKTEVS
jgi:hypothetical protein